MTAEIVIRAEGLGKKYLIGHQSERARYTALRDVIGRTARNLVRTTGEMLRGRAMIAGDTTEEFWALKDVDFELKRGEVLGIIGRNGAGKSTLLKILSRITEPTEGRVQIRGRAASLLEVGTGFHPELTGRENIFLNGAILGMTQKEIRRKFDEIVAFAEVEKFLDTPVKRYSSGMYVRLAFAVAAHLEQEILIVDEVLAVGDIDFQKKCLGKMNEVSRSQGRAVLFVSHKLESVLDLCTRAIYLESGAVQAIGNASSIVSAYLKNQISTSGAVDVIDRERCGQFRSKARVAAILPYHDWTIPFRESLSFELSINASQKFDEIVIVICICSSGGLEFATWSSEYNNLSLALEPGINNFKIEFQSLNLVPGHYSLGVAILRDRGVEDWVPDVVFFEITSTAESARLETARLNGFNGPLVASASVAALAI
jgi:lipopolysaccharide transport system ATP-binding protein